jgi:hypothetical protein
VEAEQCECGLLVNLSDLYGSWFLLESFQYTYYICMEIRSFGEDGKGEPQAGGERNDW